MSANKSPVGTSKSAKLCVVDIPIIDFNVPPQKLQVNIVGRNPVTGKAITTDLYEFNYIERGFYRPKGTSKYKGVSWKTGKGRWAAQIEKGSRRHRQNYWLGMFMNEIEAALAYDKAALQLFGEYARTNQMIYPEDFKE